MGLPVLMLDRKGVQAGTQASKQIYEPSGGTEPTTSSVQRHIVSHASLTNAMNVGDPQATRVQHVMDMLIKPHSHDHAAIYGIQCTLPNRGYGDSL